MTRIRDGDSTRLCTLSHPLSLLPLVSTSQVLQSPILMQPRAGQVDKVSVQRTGLQYTQDPSTATWIRTRAFH